MKKCFLKRIVLTVGGFLWNSKFHLRLEYNMIYLIRNELLVILHQVSRSDSKLINVWAWDEQHIGIHIPVNSKRHVG